MINITCIYYHHNIKWIVNDFLHIKYPYTDMFYMMDINIDITEKGVLVCNFTLTFSLTLFSSSTMCLKRAHDL